MAKLYHAYATAAEFDKDVERRAVTWYSTEFGIFVKKAAGNTTAYLQPQASIDFVS